ncbi:hypothetical protein O181_014490 [Austropuccinia psidii MF-1]|uniref:Uncharacterized protein n=1 Tax=Austropuccinia psidii MF-1 TaxID=1389203 RepID=A0A9Q3GPZ0_9BASI|nr:hypothetical protein [Austropuccinia psidii MF-1]
MKPLYHNHVGRGILAHHPSGPQNYIVSLGYCMFVSCMELVTFPNECFVQVGFRNWPPHMRMSHTYIPTHATATAPPWGHTHATAHTPAHTNSGATSVTPKWSMPLDIRPSHSLPFCACGTPKPAALYRGLQPCHPLMLRFFIICPWFARHTHTPAPTGLCGVLHQCHPLRQSPFMDDLGSPTPLL